MAVVTTNLGVITAYGDAVSAGYIGTKADFQENLANIADSLTTINTMSTATTSDVGKALKAKTVVNNKVTEWEFGQAGGEIDVVNVSGTNPTITAQMNKRYVCGEVSTLTITPAAQGCTDVLFTSGTTPTVLSLPQTVKMPSWFTVEASKTYEISILDGIYGAVMSWT